jgi:hypothetical protein
VLHSSGFETIFHPSEDSSVVYPRFGVEELGIGISAVEKRNEFFGFFFIFTSDGLLEFTLIEFEDFIENSEFFGAFFFCNAVDGGGGRGVHEGGFQRNNI